MVSSKKWEEITYAEIKKGDTIRVVVVQGKCVTDARGVADISGYSGWASKDGVTFIVSEDRFKPIAEGYRTIYRKKPKPFEAPQGLGAVVEAQGNGTSYKFIRADYDTDCWRSIEGHFATDHELATCYTNHIIHSEGVNV